MNMLAFWSALQAAFSKFLGPCHQAFQRLLGDLGGHFGLPWGLWRPPWWFVGGVLASDADSDEFKMIFVEIWVRSWRVKMNILKLKIVKIGDARRC